MVGTMDVLFWQLVHLLLRGGYRIARMAERGDEVWLESARWRRPTLIRLVRADFDWSRSLRLDMEYTWQFIRRMDGRATGRGGRVVNVYIMAYPPVDDWEFLIDEPLLLLGTGDGAFHTLLIHSGNINDMLPRLEEMTGATLRPAPSSEEEDPFAAAERFKHQVLTEWRRQREEERRIFEYGRPVFTRLLMIVQVAMFFVLEWSGGSTDPNVLIRYGAKFNPLIEAGEWWRFLTPMFLHIGFLHLLTNTFALYYLGTTTERLYGSLRFLIIYATAGFFGTLSSFLFTPSISAGASGAIFGLFGALLYFGTVYRHLFFRTMGMNVISLIVVNLLFGLLVPGIDNAGHIGGLVGGFLAAGAVHLPKQTASGRQAGALAAALLLAASGLWLGFR
ncbi:rhomboid family intramembrane serine protease [Geobacillus stearothermophilus]|uniref:rhomboid family intramembrane serine protease n=1 Tax=Geobacillus stearothermophilus TaxID=1422 RepID=UPI0006AC46EE|nr:rhomboid family intramembrane serine protease [Geobacillus stearothermophilus]KOR95568.1 peptidase S54 [Geobacillus stearothermophilus ATCC 12980]MED4359707.1 rhomboid family intramembrane serine protease [Geobacillus stearothermophilus]MED4880417.1 rhomboid family intramembrane serine protease [Geobacillus stearothermophilus]MED5011458.1 rhomboid family intramembrane serine protease [Geobacillus stearothermophilus]MED5015594.1 rhomboid family intramembrane serine protease [Geobacillus stea